MNIASLKKWLHKYPGDIPQLFLIGGTVRDMLLNVPPKDIDLACKGAREFAYNLAAYRNAAIVPMEKKPHTPCYRVVDREDSNNYLDIAEIRGETIYDDLMQRDFTINAIAMVVNKDGTLTEIIDPLNGSQDIKKKIVRMARQDAFKSDPLRILRAFRFCAALNFDIETLTLDEMKKGVDLLKAVSGERIFSELLLILGTTNSALFIKQMDRLGILEAIFPEIRAMKGCSQNAFHHKDVWEHSFLVLENGEDIINELPAVFKELSDEVTANLCRDNRLSLTKLAGLLHDIGKPACREIVPDTGRITFYGHDDTGAGLIDETAERLKMSNRDRDFLKLLIAEHMHVLNLAKHGVKPATKMRWFRKMKDEVIPSVIVGMADVKSTLGPDSSTEEREDFIRWSKETIKDYYEVIKKRLERRDLITGRDLIILGMEPGPEMGRILEQIRSAQDTGDLNSREDALAMARELLSK
jgi:putative nucleotidyltransferase with HDIG domain